MKNLAQSLLIATLGGLIALGINNFFKKEAKPVSPLPQTLYQPASPNTGFQVIPSVYTQPATQRQQQQVSVPLADFTTIAEKTTPAVVHIKTKVVGRSKGSNLQEWLGEDFNWGDGDAQDYSSGSGVIIHPEGYIVTNHHVIENTDEIEVILNDKRAFKATVLGNDPTTDLAVIKIEEINLPYTRYADSDAVKVGQWVLAAGNPFNLASTVTTGIVSAKARNINILRNNLAIESFIQTDAAVNPGNSGGALVNMSGDLIGINTAIATPTGYFAGYSFAVPVNIVKKVVEDIMKYGVVQRGFLGVSIQDIDSDIAKRLNMEQIEGVYVASVSYNSAAKEAGINEGDVILKVNGVPVNSAPELQEQIGRFHPGDYVKISLLKSNGNYEVANTKLKGDF